jgi:hypothetical protein
MPHTWQARPELASDDPAAWTAKALDHAKALVHEHAQAIIAVADELVERGELSGDEAQRIFSRAWMPPAAQAVLKRLDGERRARCRGY